MKFDAAPIIADCLDEGLGGLNPQFAHTFQTEKRDSSEQVDECNPDERYED